MALVLKDRVKETTVVTGTGTATLLGATLGYQSFNTAIPTGSNVYYCIAGQGTDEWEVGTGTFTAPDQLSRDTVYESSAAGSLVTFTAGTKDVFITYPAERAIYEEINGETLIDGGPITVVGSGVTSVPSLSAELGKFVGNIDLFAQIYNINQNDGANASADFVVYNSNTDVDGLTYFADMGMNSPNYSSVDYPIFTPNSAYYFSYGDGGANTSTLFLGSGDGDVRVFAGGLETNNTVVTFGTDLSTTFTGNVSLPGTFSANGAATFGNTVTLSANPTLALQAATKQYVDQIASAGLHIHEPVLVETTGNLTATYVQGGTTFNITDITGTDTVTTSVAHGLSLNDQIWLTGTVGNGLLANTAYFVFSIPASNQLTLSLTFGGVEITGLTNASGLTYPVRANSGVGATLTNSGTQVALVVDGVTTTVADRVMVRLQTAPAENGVYVVTSTGSNATNWVLTRALDANKVNPGDPNGLGTGDYFFTIDGDINAGDSHVLTTEPNTMIIGYTGLTYELFSASPAYTGIAPINVSGQNISLTGTVAAVNGGTGANTVTTGDLLYGSATNTWSKLPVGSAYKSLVVNGSGTQVEWNAIALNQSGAVSGALPATNGGTGQSSYTTGDILYSSATNTLAKLPGNTTTTKKFLGQTGNGTTAGVPAWQQPAASDITGLAPSATTDTSNASNITSGTLPVARLSGQYTGITGVGVLANGTWTANTIAVLYGGTGATNATDARTNLGLTIGANVQAYSLQLSSLASVSSNGMLARSAANTITPRTITGSTYVTISNGDGSAGNPTVSLANSSSSNSASTVVVRDVSGDFSANAVTVTNLTATGQTDLGTGSAQYIRAVGGASAPVLSAQGSGTNIDLNLNTKGTGAISLNAGSTLVKAQDDTSGTPTASTLWFTGTKSTLGRTSIKASNALWFSSGSTNGIQFHTNSTSTVGNDGSAQFAITNTTSAVNYVQVTGSVTGAGVTIIPQGSDANILLALNSKGTNPIQFFTNGARQFQVSNTTGAVNFLQVAGSLANQDPLLSAQGTDTNISLALQSKGTGGVSLATGSTGVNISNGTTVTALTRTVVGSGYTTAPTITIGAPQLSGGVQATASPIMFNSSATVAGGGTGYTVGNTLTVVGGTPAGDAATLTVSTVSGGVITGITVGNFGSYSVLPTNPVSVTGGTGSGATFNLVYGVNTFTITNAGSGYVEQPTVTFSGGGGSGAAAYASVGSNNVIRGLSTTFSLSTPGGEQLRVSDPGNSTADYVQISGGANPFIATGGASANSSLSISSRGTGSLNFRTNGVALNQMLVTHTASAVNYVQATGAATGGFPTVSAQGSDTNVGLSLASKGTAYVNIDSARTNYVRVTGANTGASPFVSVVGTDANIALTLESKGNQVVNLLNSATATAFGVELAANTTVDKSTFIDFHSSIGTDYDFRIIRAGGVNGNADFVNLGTGAVRTLTGGIEQLRVAHTVDAVNYLQVTGSRSAFSVPIRAQGSDTNVALALYAKGNSSVFLSSNNVFTFSASGPAATVNRIEVLSAITGASPSFSAVGSDTNIDLSLIPKGTGNVRFGTYTAIGSTTYSIDGYIEIKDSSGNIRKLAVLV